ncbi:MAG: hypothetical protein AAF208_02025 [Cyanobacteria bacterium P01_A01_bin.45]
MKLTCFFPEVNSADLLINLADFSRYLFITAIAIRETILQVLFSRCYIVNK